MILSPHIFRAYDIRGIADTDFDEEGVYAIGKAYVMYLKKHDGIENPKICVGRDGRLSGERMQKAFINGAIDAGAEVTDIGLSTSPLLFFSICEGKFDGGVNVTASHNPRDYNGFKLQRNDAHAICGEEIQEILRICQKFSPSQGELEGVSQSPPSQGELEGVSQSPPSVPPRRGEGESPLDKGDTRSESSTSLGDFKNINNPSHSPLVRGEAKNFIESYFQKLTSMVTIRGNPTIVIDAGNGIAGKFAPELFERLGCNVIPLYCQVDGNFPNHDADPEVEANLADLKNAVLKTKADLGIAFDGDGDRVWFIDSEGNHYSADLILLLLSRDLLSRNKGAKVVIDLKATQILFDEIKKLGGEGIMVQTGHSFVEEKMREVGALLGGEVSGHIFFGENYYGFDDAFVAAAKILEILQNSQKPMKQHFEGLPKVYNTPEIKVECPEEQKFAIVQKLVDHFVAEYGEENCLTIDGVRIDFGDGAWGIVRASNTSPKITLRFEARTEKKLEEIKGIVMGRLEEELQED